MKTIILGMLMAAGLAVAGGAMATEMPDLAKAHKCDSCHSIEERVVGPAWKSVAEKYRNDPSAPAKLQTKVSKGGRGVWGTMPMPANDPDGKYQEDIRAIIKIILAL
jgi:cytochrome c